MENKETAWVETASFTYPSEVQVLRTLLESEGIECFLKDEFMSEILPGISDVGNIGLHVQQKDVERTLEIMREGGFEKYMVLPCQF